MSNDTARLSIEVEKPLIKDIKHLAIEQNKTIREVVEISLKTYLSKAGVQTRKKLRGAV